MGETIIIVIGLAALYYISKAISAVEIGLGTRIKKLEDKARENEVKERYGSLWAEALSVHKAYDEVELWEGQLYEAENKMFGRGGAVTYAQRMLEEARKTQHEAQQDYKKALKRNEK